MSRFSCLLACLLACSFIHLLTCLLVCWRICLFGCLLARLLACFSAKLGMRAIDLGVPQLSMHRFTCLLACLLACLFACMRACLFACSRTRYLRGCLPSQFLTLLRAYLLGCLLACVLVSVREICGASDVVEATKLFSAFFTHFSRIDSLLAGVSE